MLQKTKQFLINSDFIDYKIVVVILITHPLYSYYSNKAYKRCGIFNKS